MQIRVASSVYAVLILSVLVGGTLSGCGYPLAEKTRFPDAAKKARDATDPLTNTEPITPLPRIAEEHPAPKTNGNLDQLETQVADKPDDPKRVLALAYAYYNARAYNDAARALEKAAALQPEDVQPLLYLGYTQMAVGALDAAGKTFERVLAFKGVTKEVQSEAYLQIGNIHGAQGRTEQAIAAFSKSLAYNPRQGLASLALGAWAAQNKRITEATDFFQDAVRDLPEGRHRAQAYAALGRLAEDKKDRKQAIAYYQKAMGIDSENIWANEGLERFKVAPVTQSDKPDPGKTLGKPGG